ncbi:Chorismate mutase type II [anaerobic digester metagenome]
MGLQELRAEIDDVDSQILTLILKRRDLISDVISYKKEHNLPVFAPDREQQVLKRVGDAVGSDLVLQSGVTLLYGILMDIYKFHEYEQAPKNISVPTDVGGASVRAILHDKPGALSRYLSPLAAAEVNVTNIRSQSMPGGNLLVDIELVGKTNDPAFIAALAVLADTAEKFALL